MDFISRDELRTLAAWNQGPCVSIYMPRNRVSAEAKQDSIHLRNLLTDAESQLLELGQRKPAAEALLQPGWQLQQDRPFWRSGTGDGLAILMAPGMTRQIVLPYACRHVAYAGDSFLLSNLARSLHMNGQLLLLALSINSVRLYEHTHGKLSRLELPDGVPTSMEEALKGTELEQSLQFHTTSTVGPRGNFAGMIHGQGRPVDMRKDLLAEYFRLVTRHLEKFLNSDGRPLVVAAVDYYHPIFRETCNYANLLEASIEASPDELNEQELLQRTAKIACEYTHQQVSKARDRYSESIGGGRTSDRLDDILPAAAEGRIDLLFARFGAFQWTPASSMDGGIPLEIHDKRQKGDIDLVDWSVRQTFTHGSEPLVVESDDMPSDQPLAALFRW